MSTSAIGWREWVSLPSLGVDWVKAKIDTGARSSSLHATDIELIERSGTTWAHFVVHPWQASEDDAIHAQAPIHDIRIIRSSNGQTEERPVITTPIWLAGETWDIELTLTRRDNMGFRMLVGRQALRGRVLVDTQRSYLGGRPPNEIIRQNRRKHRQ